MTLMQFIPLDELLGMKEPKQLLPVVSTVNLHTTLYGLFKIYKEESTGEDHEIFTKAFSYIDEYKISYADLEKESFTLQWPLDLDYESVLNYASILVGILSGTVDDTRFIST